MLARLPHLGHRLPSVCLAVSLSLSAAAQCGFAWQPGVPIPGGSSRIHAIASVPGQGLYAVGMFEALEEVLANRVALWNGSQWQPLGMGLDRSATSIIAESNGDIVVGGFFTEAGGNAASHLARWNGSSWSSYAGGTNDLVNCLGRMPNGDLFAGGTFTVAGGQLADRVATWDGTSWTQVGTGIQHGEVRCFTVRPNGDIAVGGRYFQLGGAGVGGGLIWDGTTWTDLGLFFASNVFALANDTNGDLLIGGHLLNTQGATLGRWDGTTMQYLSPPIPGAIRSILVEPSGSILVGGDLGNGATEGNSVARFANGTWSVIKTGPGVFSFAEHNGKMVAAGGLVGYTTKPNISEYDGTSWSALGSEVSLERLEHVVASPDGGVFISGTMDPLGNGSEPKVAHWDGSSWSSLGAGVDGLITDMVVTIAGSLVVAGDFTMAGGAPANGIASWNGSNWAPLGAGISDYVLRLASLQSGGVVALCADAPTVRVFDGNTWMPLPEPPAGPNQLPLSSVVELPNGDLVASGIGRDVVRWDGSAWSTMSTTWMRDFELKPDGTLLGAGDGVFEWDGSTFQMLGSSFQTIHDVMTLPNGDMIAAGRLGPPGQSSHTGIVRWDGSNWTPVDGGTGVSTTGAPSVHEMAFTADGELVVIGYFGSLGGIVTGNIGRAVPTCPATVAAIGTGCSGVAGVVSMAAQSKPWIGTSFDVVTAGMAPVSLSVLALGTTAVQTVLPLGAPGCSLYVQPVLLLAGLPNAGSVAVSFSIPASAALVGLSVRAQTVGIELDPSLSITTLTSSNALDLTIGAL